MDRACWDKGWSIWRSSEMLSRGSSPGSRRHAGGIARPWVERSSPSASISCSWPMKSSSPALAPRKGLRTRPGHVLPAHRGFAEFRGRSEAEWRSWLRTILVRCLAQHRRHYRLTAKRQQGREVPLDLGIGPAPESRDPTPSRELARREREATLLAAVDRLPEHYREVVIWHHREKLPFDEIARRRDISAEGRASCGRAGARPAPPGAGVGPRVTLTMRGRLVARLVMPHDEDAISL